MNKLTKVLIRISNKMFKKTDQDFITQNLLDYKFKLCNAYSNYEYSIAMAEYNGKRVKRLNSLTVNKDSIMDDLLMHKMTEELAEAKLSLLKCELSSMQEKVHIEMYEQFIVHLESAKANK